ncbi:MAG: class I adenylate-forming enzyme family protein [Acidimicrobiales bacterium]
MSSTPQTIDELVQRSVASRGAELALADAPNRASFFAGEPIRLTWGELDAAIDSVAGSFGQLGVGVGDAVAIQLPNIVELVVSILACSRAGAVAVPFPIQHRSHELRHGFSTANVKAALTAARPDRPDQLEVMSEVAQEFGGTPIAVFGDVTIDGALQLSLATSSANQGGASAAHRSAADDVATVCWTSGTTGTPKGVPRTHSMWMASSQFQVDELEITAEDRILCPFPVVNMAGIGGMLLPWITVGAALYLHQPLDLPVFLGQLSSEQITYTVAPPPLLNMLLANDALLADVDLSNIRAISSGSAPLDPWMVEGWQNRGVQIVNVFGSNEGAAMLSTEKAVPDPTERARYFPRPDRPGVEVRLVDIETGEEILERGVLGELRFRGTTVFDGYLDSTGEEFDDQGFYRTGDLFELAGESDPPNLFRFVDRAKDIIIRGGMNISAAEVEGLLGSHPSVVECAAVGFPDAELGERLGVFVVAAPDTAPTLDELADHLRAAGVASYKLPERIELIEALPRNPVGKVTKPDLRQAWSS